MFRLLLIFFAGGCGCLLRYGVAGWAQRLGNGSFPTGTLAVNVIGCLVLGFLATFSTFAYESIMLTVGMANHFMRPSYSRLANSTSPALPCCAD